MLGDDNTWPDTAFQLVFGDQRSIGVEQRQEHVEGAGPELYRDTVGKQLAPTQQHLKAAEFERAIIRSGAWFTRYGPWLIMPVRSAFGRLIDQR
ncbi:MAG TPA: hypothetical protein VGI28_15790 [Stellaceae bacterium]